MLLLVRLELLRGRVVARAQRRRRSRRRARSPATACAAHTTGCARRCSRRRGQRLDLGHDRRQPRRPAAARSAGARDAARRRGRRRRSGAAARRPTPSGIGGMPSHVARAPRQAVDHVVAAERLDVARTRAARSACSCSSAAALAFGLGARRFVGAPSARARPIRQRLELAPRCSAGCRRRRAARPTRRAARRRSRARRRRRATPTAPAIWSTRSRARC